MSRAVEQQVQSGSQPALPEARLGRMTAHLYAWSETIPALREAVGGRPGLERILARAEHVFLPSATGELHLEVHVPDPSGPATIVLLPGIGSHARFHSGALGALCGAGIQAIGLDRPGHGLSTGRRGHAPVDTTIDAVRIAAAYAKERFGTKVALVGHSLGGVDAWYALTTSPPVADAVVCAGTISHPEVLPTRQARIRAPLVKGLAHLRPNLSISIRQTAPFEQGICSFTSACPRPSASSRNGSALTSPKPTA